jgi:aspartyl-tRNA(Asn)/glutamyl-tRNA(Gln) amidotransferase subunit B
MLTYEAVVGLEIHAQLLTASKIFCGCSAAFGGDPNTHICPVCLGLPGALPVLNRTAVDYAIRAALALGCTVQTTSIFARKNYFYPDLPKGYQISQYERPLATDGVVTAGSDYWAPDYDIRIKRVHMEEDAGKLLHEGFPDSARRSYVDLNRAGVPLIEIVTEPDFHGKDAPRHAAQFFSYLRELLMKVGVNDGNMEEGSLRCDANVSVRPEGAGTLGTKAEIKNLNSFRFLEDAIESEAARQIDVIESGGRIIQETRLWDSAEGQTVSMRSKEEAHDYRYFPEPDLPPLVIDAVRIQAIANAMPELPAARRRRLASQHGLSSRDILQLMGPKGDYFDEMVNTFGAPAKPAANLVMGLLSSKMNELKTDDVAAVGNRVTPEQSARLLTLVENGTISNSMAKDVWEKVFQTGRTTDEIVAFEGLAQIDDESQIVALIADVLSKNHDAVAKFRGGATSTFGFLVGQVMKAAAGKANPKRVNELLKRALET